MSKGYDGGVGQAGWCSECERFSPEGPDVCLGLIPGVSHACCGHGDASNAYVVIGGQRDHDLVELAEGVDFITLREQDALAFFGLVCGTVVIERTRWERVA